MSHTFNYPDFISINLLQLRNYLGDLVEDIIYEDGILGITTMEEEGKVLDALWAWHGYNEVDILAYKMEMTMNQGEDENFTTNLKIQVTNFATKL
jgi:hypothetical protein